MHAAPICPYCNKSTKLVTGDRVYPSRPDLRLINYWLCGPCDAYVGTHKVGVNALIAAGSGYIRVRSDGTVPLGTPANRELRNLRHSVHAVFDPLWRDNPDLSRKMAYEWLARGMGIPVEECHIALFNPAQCRKALQVFEARKEAHALFSSR